MKHKHYDMIVAKAANMDLVVFVKTCDNGAWYEKGDNSACQWWEDSDYFLCLPQHKESCLHWLNGGKSQVEYTKASYPYWCDIDSDEHKWSDGHIFMDELLNIRIKPKKEKRWIAYHNDGFMFSYVGDSESDITDRVQEHELSDYVASAWQYKEIEVEV